MKLGCIHHAHQIQGNAMASSQACRDLEEQHPVHMSVMHCHHWLIAGTDESPLSADAASGTNPSTTYWKMQQQKPQPSI